jgi:circadian clock protein KaiC
MNDADELFTTGIAGLDAVLGGGFSHRALALIVGPPGAGKTVLASHLLFNAARHGTKGLIFTAYSEGNDQYIAHMRNFGFFDRALLGDTIQIFPLARQQADEESSPATTIARVIRQAGAKIVLLDGFQGAAELLPAQTTLREVLSALALQIRYLDVTLLVTIAGEVRDPHLHAELTVADVTIGLHYTIAGRRHERHFEVVKQRGRAQWPGLHSYQLDDQGVHVFPRLESYPPPPARPQSKARAPFGLSELDQLLGGGPNVGTTTLLAGAPGVGKTTLGLFWALNDAKPDASTLLLTFSEHAAQLEQKAAAFGLDLSSAQANGSLRVLRIPPADLDPDEVAALVLAALASGTVSRLVYDDIAVLIHELGDRTREYLGALNDLVYAANVTSLYLFEIPPFDGLRVHLTNTPLAVLGDNVIVVQQYELDGGLRRLLAVLRMRLSFFDRTLRELVLDEAGIRVLTPMESSPGLLRAGAHASGGVAPTDDASADSAMQS